MDTFTLVSKCCLWPFVFSSDVMLFLLTCCRCASQLNYAALECLITHIFDSEILVDSANRSPLVVACLEGRDATGSGDDVALSECMKILMDEHTDVDRVVELIMHPALEGNTACGQTTNQLCRRAGEGYNLTLLHILASAWQSNSCGVLLDRNALVNVPTICYYSPSSMGGLTAYTPLHLACLGHSLRFPMGEGFKYTHLLQLKDFDEDCLDGAIAEEEFLSVESGPSSNSSVGAVPGFGSIPGKYLEKNDSANGIATLEVLLQRGARPNAKTVVVPNLPQEYSQIVPYGKTVIHLLVENAAKWGDEAFNDAILMCLSYGVRLPVCEKTSDSAELNNFMSENELNGACLKFIYGKCLNSDVQAAVEQWTHKSGCLDGTKTNIA